MKNNNTKNIYKKAQKLKDKYENLVKETLGSNYKYYKNKEKKVKFVEVIMKADYEDCEKNEMYRSSRESYNKFNAPYKYSLMDTIKDTLYKIFHYW